MCNTCQKFDRCGNLNFPTILDWKPAYFHRHILYIALLLQGKFRWVFI